MKRTQETNTNNFTVEKIQIYYLNNLVKIMTFLITVETGLLGTVFKNYENKWIAFVAIFLMIYAIFLTYSMVESIIRRISPKPNFKKRLLRKFVEKVPSSIEADWIRSFLAGIFLFASLIVYLFFMYQGVNT